VSPVAIGHDDEHFGNPKALTRPPGSIQLIPPPMTSKTIVTSNSATTLGKRYRLPGIEREGIAQLSFLETALWPLKGGKLDGSMFESAYRFVEGNEQREASVRVFAQQGLQSIDEYVLWGLLGISLSKLTADGALLATPYWIMKQLGLGTGGFQYDQLRASLERLALTAYQNTGFYNPVSQQHERITLHFFSSYIPTKGRLGPVATDRAWRIEWDKHFLEMCKATGGTLLFDLDLYRELSPASRRLFLKLKDRFWRTKRVFLNVEDLTVQGLGFSAARPLKKRKYDLLCCIQELLKHKVIELGRGQSDPHDLFLRKGKGVYVVVFYEGAYFRQVLSDRASDQHQKISEDPLYEPLHKIGVDDAGIRRLFKQHTRVLIQKWLTITDAAMHEKPEGFPGFKVSPAAFLIDGVQNHRLPPDWIYAWEKRQRQDQWQRDHARTDTEERGLREYYSREKSEALTSYLKTPEGKRHWEAAYHPFLEYYRAIEPRRFEAAAADAATGKVEREQFEFPEFGVWLLNRPVVIR
jgi:hypothetical protein